MFWILYIYCLLQRLSELVISRRNQQTMLEQGFQLISFKDPIWPMILLHASWFIFMLLEAVFFPQLMPVPIYIAALIIFVFVQALRFWALTTLGAVWNIAVLVPPPEKAASIVCDGPYRWIRHPNYLVVIIELLTLPLIGGAVWTALVISVLHIPILKARIDLEESKLFAVPGYREQMGSKGRFLPKLSF